MNGEFCPRCGTERVQEFAFCGKCGFDLSTTSGTGSPVASTPREPQSFTEKYGSSTHGQSATSTRPGPTERSTRTGISPLIVVGVLLLIAVAVGGAAVLMSARHSAGQGAAATGGATPPPIAPSLSAACLSQLTPFVSALEDLNSRLSVGLNFNDYSTRVGDARVAYDKVNFSALDPLCITTVGQPAENAFNDYVKAYNTWNDCFTKTGCTNASIKPRLQADWADATTILDGVKAAMP